MSTTVSPAVEQPPAEVLAPGPATEKEKSKEEAEAKKPRTPREKKPRTPREKKPRSPREKKPRQPKITSPSFQVIKEAIVTLNEKSGSSTYAIDKYMEALDDMLPVNYRKILAFELKNSATKRKLINVKASYTLSEASPAEERAGPLSKASPTKKRRFCKQPKQPKQPKTILPSAKKAKKVAAA